MRTYSPLTQFAYVVQPEFNNKMKEEGLTQAEVARVTGVGRSFLSEVLAGKKCISTDVILRLSKHYGWMGNAAVYWDTAMQNSREWEEFRQRTKEARRMADPYVKMRVNEAVLKQALRDQGLSLVKLAEKAGVSVQTVYNVCKGKGYPKTSTAKALADALCVSVEDLFTFVDDLQVGEDR